MACRRRLRDGNEAEVRQRLHKLLLSELRAADLLDFSRVAVDSSHHPRDRGYDHEVYREKVRRFQITPHWIRDGVHHAFFTLGCAVICWRRLRTALCWEQERAIVPGDDLLDASERLRGSRARAASHPGSQHVGFTARREGVEAVLDLPANCQQAS